MIYSVFHFNLFFSSLPIKDRPTVINNCYWPLINMIDRNNLKVSLEIPGSTLKAIKGLDPKLLEKIKELVALDKIDLVASGYIQIIWQLVPKNILDESIKLDREIFIEEFGFYPKIFYLNEQCFSPDLVEYLGDLGFKGVICEYENLSINQGISKKFDPSVFVSSSGSEILLIWNSSYWFQMFQRTVQSFTEEAFKDYIGLIKTHVSNSNYLCLYGSDLEVFNYRPKRFHSETSIDHDEWAVIERIYKGFSNHLILVSEILGHKKDLLNKYSSDNFSDLAKPVYVKKQKKYNISRWALTGKNDQWINSICIHISNKFDELDLIDKELLISLFSSDLRTHIEQDRWSSAVDLIKKLEPKVTTLNTAKSDSNNLIIKNTKFYEYCRNNFIVEVNTENSSLKKLQFSNHENPIIGTLDYGYFKDVDYLADFYSFNYLIESKEISRFSDLSNKINSAYEDKQNISLVSESLNPSVPISKEIVISKSEEAVYLSQKNSKLKRLSGYLRACYITFIDQDFVNNATFSYNGVGGVERKLILNKNFNHGDRVTNIISSKSLIPVIDGKFNISNTKSSIYFSWDPSISFIMPMASLSLVDGKMLLRICFSVGEMDETFRSGGCYQDFTIKISNTG